MLTRKRPLYEVEGDETAVRSGITLDAYRDFFEQDKEEAYRKWRLSSGEQPTLRDIILRLVEITWSPDNIKAELQSFITALCFLNAETQENQSTPPGFNTARP